MKMIPILMLAMFTLPSYAQKHLNALQKHQQNQPAPAAPNNGPAVKPAIAATTTKALSVGKCEENDQTSLPLKYVLSLINTSPAQLDIQHDPRSGALQISSGNMIGNCASMIDWGLRQRERNGKREYAVEAKIAQGTNCVAGVCTYKVPKVVDKQFQKFEDMQFSPTLKGFDECLEKSGAIDAKGNPDPAATYPSSISAKFDNVLESGELYFVSRGPSSPMVGPMSGTFIDIEGCDHYEKILTNGAKIVSSNDENEARILAERETVRGCNDYVKISEFIDKYSAYQDNLNDIRDNLITEAAKKSFAAILAGQSTPEDLKIIDDFNEYIVEPKTDAAADLYEKLAAASPEQKLVIEKELKALLGEIKLLNATPFLSQALTQKLMNDGKFDEAIKVNGLKILLGGYTELGAKRLGVIITPDVVDKAVQTETKKFVAVVTPMREKYLVRTGQAEGPSKVIINQLNMLTKKMEVRNQNYNQAIAEEYARIQPGGYCTRYFRGQKCIAESQQTIQDLQSRLAYYTKQDQELGAKLQARAQEFAPLEEEGKRYIASQGGEVSSEIQVADTTMPPSRNNGSYTFEYNSQQQGGQQGQQGGQAPQGQVQYYNQGQTQDYQMQQQYQNQNQYQYQNQNQYQYQGGQQPQYYQQSAQYNQYQQNPAMNYNNSYQFTGQNNYSGLQNQNQMYQQPMYNNGMNSAYTNNYSMYGR